MVSCINSPSSFAKMSKHLNSIGKKVFNELSYSEKNYPISSGTSVKLYSTMANCGIVGFQKNVTPFSQVCYGRTNIRYRSIVTNGVLKRNIQSLLDKSKANKCSTTSSELFNEYSKMKKTGKFDIALSNKLIESYINQNQLTEANAVILSTRNEIKHFYVKGSTVKAYVDMCINSNRLRDAEKFIYDEVTVPKGGKIFASTLSDLSIAFAEHGWHNDALLLLEKVDGSKILTDRQTKEFVKILNYYAEHDDNLRLQAAFNCLSKLKMVDPRKATSWKYFVQIHLKRKDFEKAVITFEKIALEQNLLPLKFKLMEELIQNNELEKVQKVLDISIKISGEETTLYNAIFSFLSLGKTKNVERLIETSSLPFNKTNAGYIIQKFIETKQYVALEDFVMIAKTTIGCDVDYLFQRLVDAHDFNPDKMYDIWEYIQEENHTPSKELLIKMEQTMKEGGLDIPETMRDLNIARR